MELEEAVSLMKNVLTPVKETENCSVLEAAGRIAGDDIFAPINVPSFAKSAMDGYAVRSEDVYKASRESPVKLRVIKELFAGDSAINIGSGVNTAVRVMTGSPVPDGYDSVVKQEDTDYGEKTVSVYSPVKKWQNYCAVGEDIQKDELVLKTGAVINRTNIGLLSSLGIPEIKAIRKIRFSILSTGSELIESGSLLSPGKIYSSIAPMLSCSIKAAGQTVIKNQIIPDDEKEIANAIKNAVTESDVVITTGGVSVGKKDYLPAVLDSMGSKTIFERVKIQPGTPTRASLLNGKLILSLSGNPYAALANFDIYFYHILSVLTGAVSLAPEKKTAVLYSPYEKINKSRRLIRAFCDDGKVSLPAENHASSVISNLTECNCYIDLPKETACKPGDKVSVWMMRI